jgi:hypothetical protein
MDDMFFIEAFDFNAVHFISPLKIAFIDCDNRASVIIYGYWITKSRSYNNFMAYPAEQEEFK